MNEVQSLLSLPLETLAVLAAGYLGYRLGYVGRDQGHKPTDVLFISLAFAFVARLSGDFFCAGLGVLAVALIGLGAALLAATFWRVWGAGWTYRLLRAARISASDHHISAWDTIRLRRGFWPGVLVVQKTDGTLLMCHHPENFAHLRDGPFILGEDGSVALFVTDRCCPGQAEWAPREVFDPVLGHEMTYVPAGQVGEIRICSFR